MYTTIADLIGQEIIPALDGVNETFDVDALVDRLRDAGLVYYDEEANGYVIVKDETGCTPGFWDMVEELDA